MNTRLKFFLFLAIVLLVAAGCNEKLFGTPRDGTTSRTYDKASQQLEPARQQNQAIQEAIEDGKAKAYITQTVEGSNLNKPSYEYNEGQTALELLKASHTVESKEFSGVGEFVTSIDGNKADSKHFWEFFVNGKSSNIGAGSYKLQAGDKVEWKLTEIK